MVINKETTILYSFEKDQKLRRERGISFENIKAAIFNDEPFILELHPNQAKYPNQWLMYIRIDDYVHVVPFTNPDENSIVFKTIYRSSRANKSLAGAFYEETR